jgi:hypothetical protein
MQHADRIHAVECSSPEGQSKQIRLNEMHSRSPPHKAEGQFNALRAHINAYDLAALLLDDIQEASVAAACF